MKKVSLEVPVFEFNDEVSFVTNSRLVKGKVQKTQDVPKDLKEFINSFVVIEEAITENIYHVAPQELMYD